MRTKHLLLMVALPMLAVHHPPIPFKLYDQHYAGRGIIIPPTAAELTEMKCLATMIYGEARGESETGQVAVAYSAVNRATKKTVCAVVLAPKQYSIFNNNPALRAAALSSHIEPTQKNIIDERSWAQAERVAEIVFLQKVPDPTKGSTHYLAPALMKSLGYQWPKWALEYTPTTVIDGHKFFKKPVDIKTAKL